MTAPRFDLAALFDAVDDERVRRALTWAALARQIGVAPSTIRRFGRADDAEADGVLATIRWLDAVPEDYVIGGDVVGTRLDSTGGQVRVDMASVARADGDPRGAAGRTRTTIQNLVAASQRSGRPVASLTRLTEV